MKEVWIVLQVGTVGVLVFTSLSFLFKLHDFSRMFLGAYFLVSVLLMIALRFATRIMLSSIRRSGKNLRTRIVVGNELSAARYVASTLEHTNTGIQVIGSAGERIHGPSIPYFGVVEELADILKNHPADGVVVSFPLSDPRTEQVIRTCEILGVPVELVLDTLGSRLVNSSIVHSMGIPRMVVSQSPYSARGMMFKRTTDIVCSSILLLVLSQLIGFIALAIKLDDHGPVFFSQPRSGLYGGNLRCTNFEAYEQMQKPLDSS